MKLTGNSILITGGGTGIGRGLAEAFHARGNRVMITGRRPGPLAEVAQANPGIETATLDVTDREAVRAFAERLAGVEPGVNVLINNAGMMARESVPTDDTTAAERLVATNIMGPIWLTSALLPLLAKQPESAIINVSSGLAFVPLALTPTYCATKAFLHCYTDSLRYQLKDTSVRMIELIPPYVQTRLMNDEQAADPMAMPLKDFIREVFVILEGDPAVEEICVDRVKPLRLAEARGVRAATFKRFNDAMTAAWSGK